MGSDDLCILLNKTFYTIIQECILLALSRSTRNLFFFYVYITNPFGVDFLYRVMLGVEARYIEIVKVIKVA